MIEYESWELKELFNINLPENANLLYSSTRSDWSWADGLVVYQVEEKFYIIEWGGGCGYPISSDDDSPPEPSEVTQEEALQAIEDYEDV